MSKPQPAPEMVKETAPPPLPLKVLGTLEPDDKLLLRSLSPSFEARSFTQSGAAPAKLKRLLKSKGLELDEDAGEDLGLLFASNTGVLMHTDDKPSVLWVLSAGRFERPQLVCAGEHRELTVGEVVLFDARQPHGVIVCDPCYWVVLSCYVKPLKDWSAFLPHV